MLLPVRQTFKAHGVHGGLNSTLVQESDQKLPSASAYDYCEGLADKRFECGEA